MTQTDDQVRHAPSREGALDGLRGLAVAIVVVSHLANAGYLGAVKPFAGIGKSGVYLFFVLSAFLLTRLLLVKQVSMLKTRDTWLDYALRRVLRIWPLYLVVLAASWFITRVWPGWPYPMPMPDLLQHLALREGVSVLWSIPVEFKAYLVLPLLVGLMVLLRNHALLLAAGLLLLIGLAAWIWPASAMAMNDVRLGPYLPLFLAGAGAAWLDVRAGERVAERLPRPLMELLPWLMLGLWLAATPLLFGLLTGQAVRFDFNHGWIVAFGLLWAVLLLALLHAKGLARSLFTLAPMRWLGRISFSLYLWHIPVMALFPPQMSGVGVLAMVLAMLAAAALSWWLVERPFQPVRWRGRPVVVQQGISPSQPAGR